MSRLDFVWLFREAIILFLIVFVLGEFAYGSI